MMTKNIFFIFLFLIFVVSNGYAQNLVAKDSIDYFKEDSSRYFLIPISINSKQSEFCPVMLKDEMIFVSGKENRFGVVYSNENTNELLNVYVSKKTDSITFQSPKIFSKELDSPYNNGPASFNSDGTLVVFTSNSIQDFVFASQTTVQKNLQLYSSTKKNNSWSKPSLLNFCIPNFSFCHPCLSADGKTLFFASDKPGGYGEMDLYCSHFENEKWSNPINLGQKINSAANEVFPFFSKSNQLFFSSDNKSGYGGLDVYSFDFSDSANAKKQLLEQPLNSPFDDFGVYVDSSGNSGYISSNRNANDGDDIFYFYNKYPYYNNCETFIEPSNCFTFFEESTQMTDDTLGMTYEWDFGDGTKEKNLEATHCFAKTGNYKIQLNVIQKASGALFYNEATYDFTVEDSAEIYINAVDTVALNNPVSINCYKSSIPKHSILKYFWNFGDGNYSSGESGKHIYKKQGEYFIHLGVLAKNDSTQALENYCVEKKIVVAGNSWLKKKNLKYPYPKISEMIYPAGNLDSLNFRVHLGSSQQEISPDSKIFSGLDNVNEFKDDSVYRYTTGKSKKISDLIPDYNLAKEKGFTASTVVGFNGDTLLPNQKNSLHGEIRDTLVQLIANAPGNSIDRKNIFFETNQSAVTANYYFVLDSLSKIILQNPNYTIALYAFTDSVGNPKYNFALSKRRAAAVQHYFLAKGIARNRIHVIPNGEELPVDEKKTGLFYSRRVTIYLVKK